MMRKLSLLALLLLVSNGFAGSRTGADFLNLPSGARALGLGASATSMADDVDLMDVNPAGIGALNAGNGRFGSLALSHQELFLNSNLTQFGSALPLGGASAAGINVTRLSYADSEGRAADGSRNGSVGASDLAIGAAYARRAGPLQIGTQLKMIQQQLGSQSATGAALDLGFVSKTPLARVTIGGAVRNLGTPMRFQDESYALPLTFSFGGSFLVASGFSIGAGLESMPGRNDIGGGIGSEIQLSQAVSLRTGYNVNRDSDVFVPITGFSGGVGIRLHTFRLDYAVQPFGDLGTTHVFTLSSRFDRSEPKAENKELEQPYKLEVDMESKNSPLIPR